MKNFYYFAVFLLLSFTSFGQISFLKDINTIEGGSNPANFIELSGTVFFTVQKYDGFYLWKSDGTEVGTVQVSEQSLAINTLNNSLLPNLYLHNNEIYYFVRNAATSYNDLWKTDGTNDYLVKSSFFGSQIFSFNSELYIIKNNGLYKMGLNDEEILIKTITNTFSVIYEKAVILNGEIIFYVRSGSINGNSSFQIWKSNGTEAGTTLVKSLHNIIDIYYSSNSYEYKTILVDNHSYFLVYKARIEPENYYFYDTELWKTDGTDNGTVFVKKVLTQNYYNSYDLPKNLTKFNNKLIFSDGTKLWISDGTEVGTLMLKTFQYLGYDTYNKFYGILGDKFYFAPFENNENELWVSDGTTTGTQLLKNINPTGSSAPNYFVTINNKLLFRANNNNEIWQTDGTEIGTVFRANIPKPDGSAINHYYVPEFIYTSNNQLFFKNYDSQNNYELWKSDGQTTAMIKNIVTTGMSSVGSEKKVKIGNIWYFSASDHRGSELWKSDGTFEGTQIVRDINQGANSTVINEIIAIGNIIYFTAVSTNENFRRLWKSDGSENGTYEIPLSSGYAQNTFVNPEKLTVVGNKFFFGGTSIEGSLWISDGTTTGTKAIHSQSSHNPPENMIALNGKLYFTSNGLWVSDGTNSGTLQVPFDIYESPRFPVCLIELNKKLYFFSNYFKQIGGTGSALWEYDGTPIGTKIIKEFSDFGDNLTSSELLFLEKSNTNLYFRVKPSSNSFDLWTSNGTTAGTSKLKTINIINSSQTFKFGSLNNLFFLFLSSYIGKPIIGWSSDGTVNGTNIFIQKTLKSQAVSKPITFNNKLYFGIDDDNFGHELWSSDGTITGTQLVGEIREGTKSSFISGLMDFYDKLFFGAYDDLRGKELWKYTETTCNNNINYSIQSGSWSSPSTWSCGRVPTEGDNIIIKNGHSVAIPPSDYRAFGSTLFTEKGAILAIPSSSIMNISPKF